MSNGVAIREERRQVVRAKDLYKRIQDSAKVVRNMIKKIKEEEFFLAGGNLRANRQVEAYEEQAVVRLLQDMIMELRDLMYILYSKIIEEKHEGRSKVYASFRGTIERELNTLAAEIQRLKAEEARL